MPRKQPNDRVFESQSLQSSVERAAAQAEQARGGQLVAVDLVEHLLTIIGIALFQCVTLIGRLSTPWLSKEADDEGAMGRQVSVRAPSAGV